MHPRERRLLLRLHRSTRRKRESDGIDDTVPSDVYSSLPEQRQTVIFRLKAVGEGRAWHGDVFKLVVYIHDFFPTLSFCTFKSSGNQQTLVWREPRRNFTPVRGSLEKISRLDYFWPMVHIKILNRLPEAQALARFDTWARYGSGST